MKLTKLEIEVLRGISDGSQFFADAARASVGRLSAKGAVYTDGTLWKFGPVKLIPTPAGRAYLAKLDKEKANADPS